MSLVAFDERGERLHLKDFGRLDEGGQTPSGNTIWRDSPRYSLNKFIWWINIVTAIVLSFGDVQRGDHVCYEEEETCVCKVLPGANSA